MRLEGEIVAILGVDGPWPPIVMKGSRSPDQVVAPPTPGPEAENAQAAPPGAKAPWPEWMVGDWGIAVWKNQKNLLDRYGRGAQPKIAVYAILVGLGWDVIRQGTVVDVDYDEGTVSLPVRDKRWIDPFHAAYALGVTQLLECEVKAARAARTHYEPMSLTPEQDRQARRYAELFMNHDVPPQLDDVPRMEGPGVPNILADFVRNLGHYAKLAHALTYGLATGQLQQTPAEVVVAAFYDLWHKGESLTLPPEDSELCQAIERYCATLC